MIVTFPFSDLNKTNVALEEFQVQARAILKNLLTVIVYGNFCNISKKVNPTDEVVEDKGVRILIDPKAILFLIGTEMDFIRDKLQARFVFNNPNQTSECGCGESVALKAAVQ